MTTPIPNRKGWMDGPLADAPACPPFPELTDFERRALDFIAPLFGNDESAFRRQIAASEVTDRINTAVGFYTRVRVARSPNDEAVFRQQAAHFEIEGIEHGLSVILWDNDGDSYLATIEGISMVGNPLVGVDLASLKLIRMEQLG